MYAFRFHQENFIAVYRSSTFDKRILKKISASGTFLNIFFKIMDISASVFSLKKEFTCGLEIPKHENEKCRSLLKSGHFTSWKGRKRMQNVQK